MHACMDQKHRGNNKGRMHWPTMHAHLLDGWASRLRACLHTYAQAKKQSEEEARLLRVRADRAADALEAMRREVGTLRQALVEARDAAATAMRLVQRNTSAPAFPAAQRAADAAAEAVAKAASAAAIASAACHEAMLGRAPAGSKSARAASHPGGVGNSGMPARAFRLALRESDGLTPLPAHLTESDRMVGGGGGMVPGLQRSGDGHAALARSMGMPIRGGAIAAMVEQQRVALGIKSLPQSVS